jgi:hypothetical protein
MNRPHRQRNRIAVEVERRGFCAQTASSEVLHENVALSFNAPNEAVAPSFLTIVNCLDTFNSLGVLPALIRKAAHVQRGG